MGIPGATSSSHSFPHPLSSKFAHRESSLLGVLRPSGLSVAPRGGSWPRGVGGGGANGDLSVRGPIQFVAPPLMGRGGHELTGPFTTRLHFATAPLATRPRHSTRGHEPQWATRSQSTASSFFSTWLRRLKPSASVLLSSECGHADGEAAQPACLRELRRPREKPIALGQLKKVVGEMDREPTTYGWANTCAMSCRQKNGAHGGKAHKRAGCHCEAWIPAHPSSLDSAACK